MLEKKRLKSELLRVSAAKAEMDYMMEQKKEEINRILENMKIQETKEIELNEKLKLLEEGTK